MCVCARVLSREEFTRLHHRLDFATRHMPVVACGALAFHSQCCCRRINYKHCLGKQHSPGFVGSDLYKDLGAWTVCTHRICQPGAPATSRKGTRRAICMLGTEYRTLGSTYLPEAVQPRTVNKGRPSYHWRPLLASPHLRLSRAEITSEDRWKVVSSSAPFRQHCCSAACFAAAQRVKSLLETTQVGLGAERAQHRACLAAIFYLPYLLLVHGELTTCFLQPIKTFYEFS